MKRALLALALVAGAARGAGAQTAERPSALGRVVVLGASASAGFGLDVRLADALRATFPELGAVVHDAASSLFFLDPLRNGSNAVEEARAAEPTLVVAFDFLFWFSYGLLNADGKPLGAEEERLALLEKGLDHLATFSCPVVVGDLPDCSRAVGKMLLADQVPTPSMLAALNARLLAWAKERPKVVVLPLAACAQRLFAARAPPGTNGGGEIEFGGWSYPSASAAARLFQPDQLHPTLEGLALIAHLAAGALQERDLLGGGFLDEREAVLARLRAVPAKR